MERVASLLASVLFAFTACGGGASEPDRVASSPGSRSGAFPTTIEAANGAIEIASRPERIVSLSPTATEVLFAIGAGDQVIAVDDQSTYPPDAPRTKLSGYEPNIEAIARYEPDLVVAQGSAGLERPLGRLHIPLLVQPAAEDLNGTYAQIEELGRATGNVEDAEAVITSMRAEVDEIVSSLPEVTGRPTYYHELDATYYTVTSDTFIGQVYALLGLRNIADKAAKAGSDYPQLSAEYIVESDPDLIFLADTKCCGQSAETVAKRPGWRQISAVKNDAVIELDDDIASRWGPRVVDFLRKVATAVGDLDK